MEKAVGSGCERKGLMFVKAVNFLNDDCWRKNYRKSEAELLRSAARNAKGKSC